MKIITIVVLVSVLTVRAEGAAFQNVDFESASLVPIPGDVASRVYFDQAFPAWRGYVGSVSETAALTNTIFLCCSAVTLSGPGQIPDLLIDGSYSALLHAAIDPYGDPGNPRPGDTAIAQTGLVPVGTQSLLFKARILGVGGTVTLGGEPLSLTPVSTGSNYILYGADISAWAGEEAELRFTALGGPNTAAGGSIFVFDSIEFSTTPIPEPSGLALFAVAGLFALCWRRSRR